MIMGVNENIQYVKENFERKYADNIASGMYDARDLEKLQADPVFVQTYIRGKDRLDEGVDLVHSSLKFRKEIKANDLCEASFDRELFDLGALYFHKKDIQGNRILWLRVKLHRKDAPPERIAIEKQGMIYAIEKAFKENPLSKIVVLLDMSACGLSNLDVDFVKYIITIFKYYYPTFLAYMLIYDMPWIFNAAWKLIKAWLSPEAVAKIKFVTKGDVQTYIKAEDLPPYMGGTDSFEFSFKPGMGDEPLYPEDVDKKVEKKVHFLEVQEGFVSPSQSDLESSLDFNSNTAPALHNRNNNNQNNSSNEKRSQCNLIESEGSALIISPADELAFQVADNGESFDIITLTNTLPTQVAFKVKTTAPEKFRVRPSSGIIRPDKTEEIYVYLVPDVRADIGKDKFLVMAMETTTGTDPATLFKDASRDKIMQHKLKCAPEVVRATESKKGISYLQETPSTLAGKDKKKPAPLGQTSTSQRFINEPAMASSVDGGFNEGNLQAKRSGKGDAEEMDKQVEQLENQTRYLQKQVNFLICIQAFTGIVLIVVMLAYSCFGEDLFTQFLALPFDFCNDPYGRKC
ncbi:motile sperm domain-containing protein 2-like isoform X2 [Physella acuta]|uniref:motile sperm domain-containing protein 2-like isoform X2 n=1 Tax=Physella acuta TaxID=109671 RepID=UPI0027DC03FB|nr:motile sperm domain-containing protein 2-like isoform X2 [Physella acuta]